MPLSPTDRYCRHVPPLEHRDWHRATFLGAHVEAQRRAVDDVLAVQSIRIRIRDDLGGAYRTVEAEVLQALHLEHFFRREREVYWPLPVIAQGRSSQRVDGVPDSAADLTDLLRQLDRRQSRVGVLLRTPAGAGKTVAARKAFHDCFLPHGSQAGSSRPRLWGFLPCWISFDHNSDLFRQGREAFEDAEGADGQANAVEGLLRRTVTPNAVLEILARLCRPSPPPTPLIRAWLEAGPKLLLFADLNDLQDPPTRAIALKALANFQRDYGSFGHRCVISCRDTLAEAVEAAVFPSDLFQPYDLLPIRSDQVKDYLRHIEKFVEDSYKRVSEQLGPLAGQLHAPGRKLPGKTRQLLGLMDWHSRRGRGGHLLCTPLFMHLISQLPAHTEVYTLAQLYTCVAQNRLQENASLPEREITALTRAALMMHAGGEAGIPEAGVGKRVLQKAWENPRGSARSKPPDWWPQTNEAYDWFEGPYYTSRLDATQERVLRSGLLRERPTGAVWGGVNMQFIHDSFIDYFVGAWALGLPAGPQQFYDRLGPAAGGAAAASPDKQLPQGWFQATAERLHERPAGWRDPAFFLGGVLAEEEVLRLVGYMAPMQPVKGWPAVVAYLLHGGPRAVKLPALERLRAAARRGAAHSWPEALFSLCYHAVPQPDLFQWDTSALDRPWLQAESGAEEKVRPPQDTVVQVHHGPVEQLALSEDGDHVVALCCGALRCWDRETGQVFELAKGRRVTAFAMLPGRDLIALGCADGRVALALLAENKEPHTLYRTDSAVTALAARADGDELVVSHANGSLLCVREASSRRTVPRPHALRAPRMRIRHLWPLPQRSLVAGGEDGTIAWMDPTGVTMAVRHPWALVQLVATEAGDVVFADVTGTVCLRRANAARTEELGRSARPVRGLGTTAQGLVIYVDADGVRRQLQPDPPTGPAPSSGRLVRAGDGGLVVGDELGTVQVLPPSTKPASRAVTPVTAVGGSEALSFACVGREARVFAAAGATGRRQPACRHSHSHAVTCLLARPSQSWAATGTDVGEVAIWDADSGRLLRSLHPLRGPVTAMDAFGPGADAFLCGDANGALVLVSLNSEPHSVCRLEAPVTCVRTLGPDLALVGCRDGKVYRVRPRSSPSRAEVKVSGGAVIGIAGRWGECWIVGHGDGALQAVDADGTHPRSLDAVDDLQCLVAGQSGQWIWYVAGDGKGRLWFADGGSEGLVFRRADLRTHDHFGPVKHLAARPGEMLAASAAVDRMVLLWDVRGRRLLDAYEAKDIVTAVEWLSPDCLAVGLRNGGVTFLRLCGGGA